MSTKAPGIGSQLLRLVCVLFVPIAAIILLNVGWDYHKAIAGASATAFRHASDVAERTGEFQRRSFAMLQQLAGRPRIRAMADAPCDSVFDLFLATHTAYSNLRLHDREGNMVCNAARRPNARRMVADQPWFRALLSSGRRQVGDPAVGRLLGRWVSVFAEPVRDDAGRAVGALVLDVDLWNYQLDFDADFRDSEYVMTIVDPHGNVAARSRDAARWVGQPAPIPLDLVRDLRPGNTRFIRDPDGIEQLYAHATVPESGWTVFVSTPKEAVLAETWNHIQLELALGLCIMAMLLGSDFLVARRIRGPMEAAADAADAIGEGRFDVRLPEDAGNREMNVLARKFNRMAELRRATEARLEEVRDLNLKILSASPIGIAAYRDDGTCVMANEHSSLVIGGGLDCVLGANFREIPAWRRCGLRRAAEETLRSGRLRRGEFCLSGDDGRRMWIECAMTTFDLNGGRHLLLIAEDTTERKALEKQMAGHARHVEELSQRLVAVQEQERRRLSGELHDRTSPNLAAIRINLDLLGEVLPTPMPPEVDDRLADTRALLEDTTASIREICADLRPPVLDYAGLPAALEGYAQQFSARTGIPVEVDCRGPDDAVTALSADLQSLLFRIAQEALTNCAKHARAGQVRIGFACDRRRVTLSVSDDGVGFDTKAFRQGDCTPGLGLLTMRERAEFAGGRFSLRTRPGRGTEIRVDIDRGNGNQAPIPGGHEIAVARTLGAEG